MLENLKYRIRVLRALRPFAFGVKRFLCVNLFVGLMLMALGFIRPVFYKLFIDRVILGGEVSLMPRVILGYLGVFILSTAFAYLKNYSTNRLVNRVTFLVKTKILRGFFRRDPVGYEQQSIGDMKMRLEDDTACIGAYAGAQTVEYAITSVTLTLSALLLFSIKWRMAAFSCTVIPLTFWLDRLIAKREKRVQNKQRENDQQMSTWLHASVQGWREIKALNLQKHERRQLARYIHRYAILFKAWINFWTARVLVIPKIKEEFFMRFSLYFFGGLLIMKGRLEIGALLVFMQYYGILSGALKTVSTTDAELVTSSIQSDRMLAELSLSDESSAQRQRPGASNAIELRGVDFSYPGTDKRLIENLNLFIGHGERIAITGKSGAGKTTVLKLITGMLRPTGGMVLFSNVNLNDLSLDAVYQRIGFITQENRLFNASIRKNLCYGKENAHEAELYAACRKAFILDFIQGLPEGLDTVIGERGIKLSGGQRQRLVLARLFLRDVSVFIFDEATSALDQYSEGIVQDAIRSIGKDKTLIVVAHRQSSIALCDRVVTL